MADSYQNDYIQHPLLYELSHKYRQQLNEYVPEAAITFKLEELKEHIRKEMRKELKIKEGAEKLRDVSKDKKTLSDVASIVKKSNLKLNEMQADLQELESQIILTQGQSTQPTTPNCNNSLGDLTYAVTPTMTRYNSTIADKNMSHDTPPVHQSNFTTDFKILSLEKQLNIELKVKQGAENMIQSLTSSHSRDKKILAAEAQQMLADSKAKIEFLRMRIMKAKQHKEQMCSANGDVPNNNNSNKDKFEKNLEPVLEDRIEELRHRLRIELAVYEGAKNVIRSFQNAKSADKKTLQEISKSNEKQVALNEVQREMTGYYKCEVSADAPSFHTDIKSAVVIVIEEPKAKPLLTIEKTKYSISELVRVNCTSYNGYPAPNITWFINSNQINDPRSSTITQAIVTEANGLETIKSRLEIYARASHFKEGRMRIKCQANQYDLYQDSSQVVVEDDRPQLAPVLSPSSMPSHDHCSRINVNRVLLLCNILFISKFIYGR